HLAGVTTAVATCGTAFGSEHVKIVRRVMGDSNPSSGLRLNADGRGMGGEVIFTFDGDAAGQKAALRAFEEDQRFVAQTYVAVEPGGMDPCDLRLTKGDAAVLDLIDTRRPMFEFAIRSAIAAVDLDTVEGQVSALRMAAPVVARIRDRAMRPEYARRLSGWLGMDERTVLRAVHDAARAEGGGGARDPGGPAVGRGQPPRSGGAGRGAVAGRDAAVPGAAVGPAGGGAARRRLPCPGPAGGVGRDARGRHPARRRRRHAQPGSLSRPGARDRRGDGTPPDRGDHESRPARSGRAGPGAAGGIFAGPPQRAVHHP